MDKIKASQFADLAYLSRWRPPSRLITFAAPTTTLTNFPALVKCNSTFHIGTQTGYDVHFQDLSGNELYFDLDFYDNVTGNGAWWVQIPSLSSNGPTSIKMLYGDSSASTNQSAPATVWSDYIHIYHCSGSNPLSDSKGTTNIALDESMSYALVSGMHTGQGVAITPTVNGNKFFTYGETINTQAGASYSLYAHATALFEHSWETGWSNYGFMGWSNPFYVIAASIQFPQSALTFPAYESLNFSAGPSGAFAVFNSTALDLSAATYPSWIRDDSHRIQVRPSCVYTIDEFRQSSTVERSESWLLYEQAQITDHTTYTTYGPEA